MSQISVNNYKVSKTHVLPPGRTPWVVPSIPGYSRTHGLFLSIPGYSTYWGYFPSRPASHHLQWERVWYIFSRERCHKQVKLYEHGHHVNHENHTHTLGSTTILSWKMAAHEGDFYETAGGQWVLQSSLDFLCTGWTLCNLYSRPWAEHRSLALTTAVM